MNERTDNVSSIKEKVNEKDIFAENLKDTLRHSKP